MTYYHRIAARRNTLLDKKPNIASQTVMRVWRVTDEYVYADPIYIEPSTEEQRTARESMHDLAIVCDWKFIDVGCEMTACNPFYPRTKRCRGMRVVEASGAVSDQLKAGIQPAEAKDESFAFDANGMHIDACQPACYDDAIAGDNMVGLFGMPKGGKCLSFDPMMFAFYTDPTRRYQNHDKQILEKRPYDVSYKPMPPDNGVAMVASMTDDYCDQYGLKLTDDGEKYGTALRKCGNTLFQSLTSWLIGDTITRSLVTELSSTLPDILGFNNYPDSTVRHEPTRPWLKDESTWNANVRAGVKKLPTPLTLSSLGIVRGTCTEWLEWTDEFAHLDDGRNDQYGGRLVERANTPPYCLKITERVRRDTARYRASQAKEKPLIPQEVPTASTPDIPDPADIELQAELLRAINKGAKDYRDILATHPPTTLLDIASGLGEVAGGIVVQHYFDKLAKAQKWPTIGKALKASFRLLKKTPKGIARVSARFLGLWTARATVETTVEKAVVKALVARSKAFTMSQVLGPIALFIDILMLVGMVLDLVFVALTAFGVPNFIDRHEHYVSDRRLLELAEHELSFNRRLFGTPRVEITPYHWMVNTPYMDTESDLETSISLMPTIYNARSLNSLGGWIRPQDPLRAAHGGGVGSEDGEFVVNPAGNVVYVHHAKSQSVELAHEDELSLATDDILNNVHTETPDQTFSFSASPLENPVPYYVLLLFVAVVVLGVLYPRVTVWSLSVATMTSLVSVLLPLGVSVTGMKYTGTGVGANPKRLHVDFL